MSKHYPFTLEPLPYAYDALSPVLDARTLEFHHDKHLQTYVDNLNAALKDAPSYHTWELERLILQLDSLPENLRTPVRNNAGGVYNPELYFASMTGGESRPGPAMLRELEKAFGSYEAWKEQMKQAALTQFGSGWAWLIADAEDGLHIVKTLRTDKHSGTEQMKVIGNHPDFRIFIRNKTCRIGNVFFRIRGLSFHKNP